MKTKISSIASSFLALMLVTAHGSVNPTPSLGAAETRVGANFEQEAEPSITLDASHDGASIVIPTGTLVTVILKATPSTGYDWTPTFSSANVLDFQKKELVPIRPFRPGCSCEEHWVFRATAPGGTTTLTLSLNRPWLKDASPLQTIHFDITVQ